MLFKFIKDIVLCVSFECVVSKKGNSLFCKRNVGSFIEFSSSINLLHNRLRSFLLSKFIVKILESFEDSISFLPSKQNEYLYNHVGRDPEPLGEAIHYTNPVHKHYCCKSDGSYNMNDRKIHMDAFLGKMPLQFKDPPSLLFVSVPYEELDTDTVSIRNFNEHVFKDERVEMSMIPVGDGLTLALKR